MEKTIIQVPKGIRYFNEFEQCGFHLDDYPYILDKKMPGCGFTSWALTNSQNIILASPRKMLMRNKKKQHGDSVFLVQSQINTEVDKDLNSASASSANNNQPSEILEVPYPKLRADIKSYIGDRISKKLPAKILVTYDSYRKVREILEEFNIFQEFYTIVDEFQSIFTDSRFKSSTEMEFTENLMSVQKVCFVSATPMMEEYLEMLDYFKDLPYHELDWGTLDPGRVIKPNIKVRSLKSINTAIKPIIQSYKDGKFEHKLVYNPSLGRMEDVESKELVVYVNSVTNIIGIIKACGLMPDEVNILCSDTTYNANRISTRLNKKRQGIIYTIGEPPVEGEPRKMFTFCTRTVYLGADFYSDNARTVILSDANIDTLAVDITLDLPQIMGRQRLKENPWKDEAILFVRPLMKYKALDEEEFRKEIERKLKETQDLLTSYENTPDGAKMSLVNRLEKVAKVFNYKDDYVSVNHHSGSQPVPVFNALVAIAEKRAFEVQQKDYADRFTVFNRLMEAGNLLSQEQTFNVQAFMNIFDGLSSTKEKMKYLCTTDIPLNDKELEQIFRDIPDFYRNFYLGLGLTRCKALGYDYSKMQSEYSVKFFDLETLRNKIMDIFKVGDKVSVAQIKDTLRQIYLELGYRKNPKATDLNQWFSTRVGTVKDPSSGKWVKSFELLDLK